MKIHFSGDISTIQEGLTLLSEQLKIVQSEDGYPIHVRQREGNIIVSNQNGQGEIQFERKIHFFRALGLWLENFSKKIDFEIEEKPQFVRSGVMLEASRNAVLTVKGIQDLLRKMAVMGLNEFMLYTEDTYEVEKYPYFGYMRGRYTQEELRTCDSYADALGIEMIPCIQTLGHMTEAIKWSYAAEIRDTSDILLVNHPKTYEFIEEIIQAATKPFRSNRIHIGMDEAHQLGLGRYLDQNGYQERFTIMNTHLQKVVSITKRLGLDALIWSDMYFRLGSKTGDYYDLNADIPEEAIQSIPDVQLVYWDYYHEEEDFYRTFIQKHKELKPNPYFAGGVWTWNGIAPNYGKAIATTQAALKACKTEGVREITATMWGDNGAETPLTTSLPILQLFAEHSYHENVDMEQVKERFHFCTGGNYDDFYLLNQFDETPGVSKDNLHISNPSKWLLYQDLLIGLFDKNIEGLSLGEHYSKLIPKLEEAKEKNPEWNLLFDLYEQLARVLCLKAELGIRMKQTYDDGNKDKMVNILNQLYILQDQTNDLRKKHRTLWLAMNKPFGWEVLDIRYGGILSRMETARYRINQWVSGEVDKIGELEEERLVYEGLYQTEEGSLGSHNIYSRIVTACPL